MFLVAVRVQSFNVSLLILCALHFGRYFQSICANFLLLNLGATVAASYNANAVSPPDPVRSETASFVEQDSLPSSSQGSTQLDSYANPQLSCTSTTTHADN